MVDDDNDGYVPGACAAKIRARGLTERDKTHLRRVIRANRLLTELGYTDILEALEELRRLKTCVQSR